MYFFATPTASLSVRHPSIFRAISAWGSNAWDRLHVFSSDCGECCAGPNAQRGRGSREEIHHPRDPRFFSLESEGRRSLRLAPFLEQVAMHRPQILRDLWAMQA